MEQDHQLPIACSFSSSAPPNLAIIGAIHLFLRQAITLLSPAGPSLCLFSSTHLVIPDLRVCFAHSGLFIANRSRLILFWLPLGLTGSLKDLVEKLVEKRQIGGMYVPSLITSGKAKNHVLSPSPPRSPPPNFPAGHAVGSVEVMLAFMCLHCSYHLSAQEMDDCDACHEPCMRKSCWRCVRGSHGCKNVPAILIPYLNDDIRAKDALLLARHRQSAHLRM
ncbi:hypothetical protein M438DRAFT_169455 [Aureobasidium pullulans EXF-150]|uniref:Uncharacterized protein n=1 Tax=Aureobasidium pullulans EXF-150 TaxID=1043002 RepID=A0A074WZY2_AURPU|nr:uncharacterized protein M438DRAFT_169455 [Aureobasidium pullulans EXF-150]KEQ78755.1 hypothetical protein M438DRAFT_169455 [Aureobasidium pullulans EXF-150]